MDKREAVRVPALIRAQCRSHGIVVDGRVEDLSRSGLFLRASSSIREGSAVDLDIDLPGEATLRGLAVQVVRVEHGPEGFGLGLRFVTQPEQTRSLANFIMRQHQTSL